jgi:hypothetical protein
MKSIKQILEDMNKLMPLAAIWLNDKVNVETEEGEIVNTLRITKGMHIYVSHSTILDVRIDRPANYTIESVWGDIYSTQLEAHLISNTGEILKLILK